MPATSERSSAAPVRARRNLRWILAGVLAVCLGGLGSIVLYANLAATRSVIAITRTVFRDQVITAGDLGVITVAPTPGVDTVSADLLPEIVGRSALTDLTQGSLLNPRMYGEPPVEVGTAVLGLKLPAGRLPSSALPPGTSVVLVPVGRDGAEPPAGTSVAARVASSSASATDGVSVLDVAVPAAEAERVARLAAADQIVLVRDSGVRS